MWGGPRIMCTFADSLLISAHHCHPTLLPHVCCQSGSGQFYLLKWSWNKFCFLFSNRFTLAMINWCKNSAYLGFESLNKFRFISTQRKLILYIYQTIKYPHRYAGFIYLLNNDTSQFYISLCNCNMLKLLNLTFPVGKIP